MVRNDLGRLVAVAGCALLAALASAGPAPEPRQLPPLSLPRHQLAAPADPARFRFAVGGDNRTTGHGDPMPPALREICTEIGLIRPDFVLWTGDTIHGYNDTPGEAAAEYRAFRERAALCRTPFFNIPGNHELGGGDSAALERVYQERMGRLYGSFDYGNNHFIGLDTTPVIDGKAQAGTLDPAQREWLDADLAAHAAGAGRVGRSANLFLFMHHYVFGPPSMKSETGLDTGFASVAIRDDLHQLFRRYGVRAVFCGHAHLYWHLAKDGIDYFIAGNAGAPLELPPDAGGFLGYMLVDVDGTKITTRALPAWTLLTRTVKGGDGRGAEATMDVSNYTADAITVRGISVTMPAAKRYEASATATYKGKTADVPVSVVSAAAAPEKGSTTVTLAAELPWGRTTRFLVRAR